MLTGIRILIYDIIVTQKVAFNENYNKYPTTVANV